MLIIYFENISNVSCFAKTTTVLLKISKDINYKQLINNISTLQMRMETHLWISGVFRT